MLSGSLDFVVKYDLNMFNEIHAHENKVLIWVLILRFVILPVPICLVQRGTTSMFCIVP